MGIRRAGWGIVFMFLLVAPVRGAGFLNGDFEQSGPEGGAPGWLLMGDPGRIRWVDGDGVGGSRAVRFDPNGGEFLAVGQEVPGAKEGVAVTVRVKVRCENLMAYAGLWLIGSGSKDYVEADRSRVRGTKDWQTIIARMVPSAGCTAIRIKIGAMGPGTVWFDNLEMFVGEEADKISDAASPNLYEAQWGLFRVEGRYRARVTKAGQEHEATFPIPLSAEGQAPLSFRISTEPAVALVVTTFEHRSGPNWIARAKFATGRTEDTFEVRVDSLVLAAMRDYGAFDPKLRLSRYRATGGVPAEAKPWLRSSEIVQTKSPRIRDAARRVTAGAETLGELLDGLSGELARIRHSYASDTYSTNWDAVSALTARTGCCGDANLVAALLRANHVPARILAGYPPRSDPLATHYVVEYYVPGFGWAIYESSRAHNLEPPSSQIEVSMVSVEDEDAGVRRAGVVQDWFWVGTPLHSVTELPGAATPAEATLRLDGGIPMEGGGVATEHRAVPHRLFRKDHPVAAQRDLVELARARWEKLLATGRPEDLAEAGKLADAADPAALAAALSGK